MGSVYTFRVNAWVVWVFVALFGVGAIVLGNLAIQPPSQSAVKTALLIGGICWALFAFSIFYFHGINWKYYDSLPSPSPERQELGGAKNF